jgi:uncharacterized membrane protein YgcG
MIKSEELFQKSFRRSFSLRLHMSLILLATASSGILGSKLFHVLHVENVVIRFPLAVLLSYGVFFVCIRLWLLYVSPVKGITSGKGDWLYIPSYSGRSAGGGSIPPLRGGGGDFSGAGASASFENQGVPRGRWCKSNLLSTSGGIPGTETYRRETYRRDVGAKTTYC